MSKLILCEVDMLKPGADIIDTIAAARLLPVVVLERADDAVPLAKALVAGGLSVCEVTFRSDAAADSIAAISRDVPDMTIGAGTVLTADHVDAAASAGARFLITPGFNPIVIEKANTIDLPIVPGINNPTGVEQAMSHDLEVVKFFPAEASGGPAFIKALSGPYRNTRFVPTGGISADNLAAYLALPAVLACGGSWMVEPQLIADGRFDDITRLTATAVATARTARPEKPARHRA